MAPPPAAMPGAGGAEGAYVRRVLIAVGLGAAVAVGLVLAWRALDILLLLFTGVLLGVILRWLRDVLAFATRLPPKPALALALLLLVAVFGGLGAAVAPVVKDQVAALSRELPKAIQNARDYVAGFGLGRQLLQNSNMDLPEDLLGSQGNDGGSETMNRIAGIFSTTLGIVFGVFLILVVGIYLAAEPELYRDGILRLLPPPRRDRARQVLERLGHVVRWWLLGQMVTMVIIGSLTTLGLWLLNMPLALALGLLAALTNIIPNLGPFIAGVPAVLIALTVSPITALYVVGLYLLIQNLEGYFITPLVQRRVIALPPALIIAIQALLGSLAGFLGVLVAAPLLACLLVLVQMLYVEDVLRDSFATPP